MPNIFKNDEQRRKWNEYNKAYAKRKFKSLAIKLDKEKDKDIIEVFDSYAASKTGSENMKRLIRLGIEVDRNSK